METVLKTIMTLEISITISFDMNNANLLARLSINEKTVYK